MADNLPLYDEDLEFAVLSCLLMNPDQLPDVRAVLCPQDFFIIKHGWIYAAMLAVQDAGLPVDTITLLTELKARGQDEESGGMLFLHRLLDQSYDATNGKTYGILIQRLSARRQAVDSAGQIATSAFNPATSLQDLSEQIAGLAIRMSDLLQPEQHALSGDALLSHYYDTLERRVQSPSRGITLPWASTGELLPVLPLGSVIIFKGATGKGKTILLEQGAEWAAALGEEVFYVTTELTEDDMMDRMAARQLGLSRAALHSTSLVPATVIADLQARIGPWIDRLSYWRPSGQTAATIYQRIVRAIDDGARYIAIDYLQECVNHHKPGITPKQALDNFTRAIYEIAKDRLVTFFIASQVTTTDHGVVTYGSAVPEHKAAAVALLRTEETKTFEQVELEEGRKLTAEPGTRSLWATLEFTKNNLGGVGKVPLLMDGARYRFLDETEVNRKNVSLDLVPMYDAKPDPVYRGD